MPGQTLNLHSPETAARDAMSTVLSNGSRLPLIDAANLLIDACRQADPKDPGWTDFLQRLDQIELDVLAKLARSPKSADVRFLRIV